MSYSTTAEKRTLHFLDINASEVENYPSALQDIVVNRRFDGMVIREVFPLDTVERVVRGLKSDDSSMKSLFREKRLKVFKPPQTYGVSTIGEPPDLNNYFALAPVFRQACRTLFQGNPDFEERVESIFRSLCGGLPVQVPPGPEGQTYAPANIRVMPDESYQIPVHVGNEFRDLPSNRHLRSLIDISDQFSYFILLSAPEAGGELVVYNREWNPETASNSTTTSDVKTEADSLRKVDQHIYEAESLLDSQQQGSVAFAPNPGDMMLFNGGRYYHKVNSIVGHRPRITIGGFLSYSLEHDSVYYWS